MLEGVVHPLVADERRGWLQQHHEHPVLLLDIPLLYETGAESTVRPASPPLTGMCRILLHSAVSEGAAPVHAGGRGGSCQRPCRGAARPCAAPAGHDRRCRSISV